MPEPHRKTLHRREILGQPRFLTFSCLRRQPFLSKDRSRAWVIQAIALTQKMHEFNLWAYVLMPEHVHLLIQPTGCTVDKMLNTLKQSAAKRALHWIKNNAPQMLPSMQITTTSSKKHSFWQPGGGFDRNLRSKSQVWEVINYIHRNPVDRGLCARPQDWPWSSANDFLGNPGPLKLNLSTLPK